MDTIALPEAREAVKQALRDGTAPQGLPAAMPFSHGSMKLYFYEPRGTDQQTPHEQDELYVVITGSGTFALEDVAGTLRRTPFGPGDAIFVPAGTPHRFEDFTEDFETWVIMYGPEGGEGG